MEFPQSDRVMFLPSVLLSHILITGFVSSLPPLLLLSANKVFLPGSMCTLLTWGSAVWSLYIYLSLIMFTTTASVCRIVDPGTRYTRPPQPLLSDPSPSTRWRPGAATWAAAAGARGATASVSAWRAGDQLDPRTCHAGMLSAVRGVQSGSRHLPSLVLINSGLDWLSVLQAPRPRSPSAPAPGASHPRLTRTAPSRCALWARLVIR